MSKLDKEQVLADFTAAYEKANGKKPKIEDNNGWYSVDGGKNVRLAQLAEDAKSLGGGKKTAAKKAPAAQKETAPKKAPAAKKEAASKKTPAAKKPASKSKASTKKSSSGGLTAKELWKQKLEEQQAARLPRGMQ